MLMRCRKMARLQNDTDLVYERVLRDPDRSTGSQPTGHLGTNTNLELVMGVGLNWLWLVKVERAVEITDHFVVTDFIKHYRWVAECLACVGF